MGLKITDKRTTQPRPSTCGSDIPSGQVFEGRIGACRGIFLRSFDRITLLQEPTCTWAKMEVVVDDYRPVTAELVITD